MAKALEEGIRFAERLTPEEAAARRVRLGAALRVLVIGEADSKPGAPPRELVTLPARTILVAAGTQPNTVLAREDPEHVHDRRQVFPGASTRAAKGHARARRQAGRRARADARRADGRAISFFGDLHPSFSGNVVKAMASAKQGYPVVTPDAGAKPPPSGIAPQH